MTRKASLDYQLPGPLYEGPMEDRSDGSQYQQLALERMGLGCLRITA